MNITREVDIISSESNSNSGPDPCYPWGPSGGWIERSKQKRMRRFLSAKEMVNFLHNGYYAKMVSIEFDRMNDDSPHFDEKGNVKKNNLRSHSPKSDEYPKKLERMIDEFNEISFKHPLNGNSPHDKKERHIETFFGKNN